MMSKMKKSIGDIQMALRKIHNKTELRVWLGRQVIVSIGKDAASVFLASAFFIVGIQCLRFDMFEF